MLEIQDKSYCTVLSFIHRRALLYIFLIQQRLNVNEQRGMQCESQTQSVVKRSIHRFPIMLIDEHCCYSSYKSLPIYKGASMEILQDCFCMSVHDNKRNRHVILNVAQAEQKFGNRHFSATWAVNTGLDSAHGCGQWQIFLQPASNAISLRWI